MSRAIGVALDIDGVLLRGKNLLPMAKTAVSLLKLNRIPTIYLTNGGGLTEVQKAKQLSDKLGIQVESRQILQSHTPFRSLAPEYSNKNILVLGSSHCLDIAHEYGFKQIFSADMVHAHTPSIYPQRPPKQGDKSLPVNELSAIFNFHDPIDWALEMQVVTDALLSPTNSIPYYACNADLVYSAEYPRPRYTQGAFNSCLQHLLMHAHDYKLHIHYFGKPFEVQYRFAENMLHWEAHHLNLPPPNRFFGVGDNPKADIRGANNAGMYYHCYQRIYVRSKNH
jgi:HAD superfamily hydrolase (TIGR01456 family)